MREKIGIIILITACSVIGPLYADVAPAAPATAWTGGSIYLEDEDPFIALTDEILYAEEIKPRRSIRLTVHFRFRNDSDSEKHIPVGFPVITDLYQFAPSLEGWTDLSPALLGLFGRNITIDNIERIHGKQVKFSWGQYREKIGGAGTDGDDPASDFSFSVVQDGTNVPVDRVIVEGKTKRIEEGPRDDTSYDVSISTNLMFTLKFPPREDSEVIVTYTVYAAHITYRGSYAATNYVIGSGGAWKGPIENLYILGRIKLDVEDAGPSDMSVYEAEGSDTILAVFRNYEPKPEATIGIRIMDPPDPVGAPYWAFSELTGTGPVAGDVPSIPVNSSIRNIRASSVYPGDTKIALPDKYGALEWRRTTYGAAALFDGITLNAWVEGVPGPGIGESVEFELTEPAFGLTAYNGLRMVPRFKMEERETYYTWQPGVSAEGDRLNSIWERNHRVKELQLLRGGREAARYTLDDRHGAQILGGYLPPGRYRAVIRSVYPGTEWDDTCLGEILLHTLPRGDIIRERSPELWESFTVLQEERNTAR